MSLYLSRLSFMWDHIPHPWTLKLLPCDPLSAETHEVEVKARLSFIPDQHTSEWSHTWLISKPPAKDNVISKWCRQVIPLYSRKHCIMNLGDAPLPCSRHACPASYSGSYLNNWFKNLESQSCEFHAYKQVEELFFNRACSRHGSGECMFYELRKHENTAVCQLELSPWDKEEGWVTFGFVGVLGTERDFFFFQSCDLKNFVQLVYWDMPRDSLWRRVVRSLLLINVAER